MVRVQMCQEDLFDPGNGNAGQGQLARYAIAGIYQIVFAIHT